MPADSYSKISFRVALQTDDPMRCDEPLLWHFANVVIWAIHPWVSVRVWWLER